MNDEQTKGSISQLKSRLISYKAGVAEPLVRTVGSVTLVLPEFDDVFTLRGVGYTLILKEAKDAGQLREASIVIERLRRPKFRGILKKAYWVFLCVFFGIALARAWYLGF